MEKIPLETLTLYAELIEQLTALEAQRSIGHAPGCFTRKVIKGTTYYYFQYSGPGGVQRQVYVGRRSAELDHLVKRYESEKEAFRADASHIQRLCAQLRAGGALTTDTTSARVLKSFSESGVFYLDGVLLGTHAFIVLGNVLGVQWERSALRTQDIDIATESRMSIGLPNIRADVPEALGRLEMGFIPVPPMNPKNPSTSFKVRGRALRVDFLTPEVRRGDRDPVFISHFNVAAQPIPFLDYLIRNPIKAAVVDGGGVLLNVPEPARFALHKLIISQERDLTAHGKVGKDILQAAQIISVLIDERPGDILQASDEIRRRGKGWIGRLKKGFEMMQRSYEGVSIEATRLMRIK